MIYAQKGWYYVIKKPMVQFSTHCTGNFEYFRYNWRWMLMLGYFLNLPLGGLLSVTFTKWNSDWHFRCLFYWLRIPPKIFRNFLDWKRHFQYLCVKLRRTLPNVYCQLLYDEKALTSFRTYFQLRYDFHFDSKLHFKKTKWICSWLF